MNKKIPLIIIIGILALISLIYANSIEQTSNNVVVAPNNTALTSSNKVVIIAPHPDDETIGMGGIIQKLKSEGKEVHVVVMCSGNGITDKVPLTYNYYNLTIPSNASMADRKKIIREDSFIRAMSFYNVSYEIIGLDDGATTDDNVFNVMERLKNEGYGEFYTTTGDHEADHLHCANALKLMMEKYPQLKYRQFPIYWHAADNGPEKYIPTPLVNNYTDYNVSEYNSQKLEALQVYYNIQIFQVNLYQTNIERIYYLN
jgi:LmbE family N-acetylglucosaminyl deacetylase